MTEEEKQAALDALEELANTRMELSMSDWSRICSTIRAALTAQDVNKEIDLDNAREVFENWLTGNGNYPHLKYKSFGGVCFCGGAAVGWEGFKAGYYARAEQKAAGE